MAYRGVGRVLPTCVACLPTKRLRCRVQYSTSLPGGIQAPDVARDRSAVGPAQTVNPSPAASLLAFFDTACRDWANTVGLRICNAAITLDRPSPQLQPLPQWTAAQLRKMFAPPLQLLPLRSRLATDALLLPSAPDLAAICLPLAASRQRVASRCQCAFPATQAGRHFIAGTTGDQCSWAGESAWLGQAAAAQEQSGGAGASGGGRRSCPGTAGQPATRTVHAIPGAQPFQLENRELRVGATAWTQVALGVAERCWWGKGGWAKLGRSAPGEGTR
jgi:hypothetical protein